MTFGGTFPVTEVLKSVSLRQNANDTKEAKALHLGRLLLYEDFVISLLPRYLIKHFYFIECAFKQFFKNEDMFDLTCNDKKRISFVQTVEDINCGNSAVST